MAASLPLRNAVAVLASQADRDLLAVWRTVRNAVEAREALADILPALVDAYGAAAAALAAQWYDDLREKLAVAGRFEATPADVGATGAEALAGWGVSPLFSDEPDWAAAKVLIAGGLQRRIANQARLTVARSSIADPQAHGWQRVGDGGCGFCAMLIGRGAVYSEASADFASHDHCNCGAEPAFKGHPHPVKPYTPSERKASDADRARVRAYLRDH